MAKLLENGKIAGQVPGETDEHGLIFSTVVHVPPSDPDYELWINWLMTDEEIQRARKLFAEAHPERQAVG